MKPGTRALLFALFVVLVGAVLSYLLRDSGPFSVASGSSALGKFGYDAMRDRSTPSSETEYGD